MDDDKKATDEEGRVLCHFGPGVIGEARAAEEAKLLAELQTTGPFGPGVTGVGTPPAPVNRYRGPVIEPDSLDVTRGLPSARFNEFGPGVTRGHTPPPEGADEVTPPSKGRRDK